MNAIKKRIVFVTGNANKLKEVQAIMGENFDVISVSVDRTCAIFLLSTDVHTERPFEEQLLTHTHSCYITVTMHHNNSTRAAGRTRGHLPREVLACEKGRSGLVPE